MGKEYDLTPREIQHVESKHRRMVTRFPVPESLTVLERLRRYEPVSMRGQPPVIWDRAQGFQVHDPYGNVWMDWSSGVLVTSAGHGRQRIVQAIVDQAKSGLLHNYCFPSEIRARLAERLVKLAPEGIDKAFLLTTGSEATENVIKLGRTHGERVSPTKVVVVTYERAFHGRTLGAQLAGGIPELKEWIPRGDPTFVQVPFPDGFRTEDQGFELFEKSLEIQGVDPADVACVMTETYQGGGASFAPPEYVRDLRRWCNENRALLAFDEVQAGFGRTGKFWGFEHYGVIPDLICCGKAISSSLPLSAVLGPSEIMDIYAPGTMTSTHTGNPVCCAAALANIDIIEAEGLVENSRKVGEVLQAGLMSLKDRYPDVIGAVHGKGLVAGLHMVEPGSKDPDGDLAFRVVEECVRRGLLMFSPVGYGGATVKISPPLVITEEAVSEGVGVLDEAIAAALPA
jgi:4-aminobutyrate aminotransferase/(S)-3-amino-2-methylpropionate transaminase